MRLAPGARLGPYEVIAPIGAGGMGEVYRARDSRLGREVALKVIGGDAENAEATARFEREARAVAALSHPNVVTLHDFGRHEGVDYAVCELLEGETLRARLVASPLPWRRAVEIAVAIADALAAAHARGIVHRDLKPENVFLTVDGRVKVLDFGLARHRPPVRNVDVSSAPTVQADTEPGVVLGTVGYMSPEQVRGEELDAPTDIFSLGCVLHEMISGRRAFQRSSAADTLAAILTAPAPELPSDGGEASVPRELSRVLAHCLEKRPADRFQSARDLAYDLRTLLEASAQPRVSSGSARRPVESIAVLPLANAGADPETDYLCDGITETIIASLSRVPGLKVLARSAVFRFKGAADPLAVGRELGVKSVLTGRVVTRGGTLVVKAELVDLADATQLWGEKYSRPIADIFEIEDDIARRISDALKLTLRGEEAAPAARRTTANQEAYRAYLKGRFHWNKRSPAAMRLALAHFREAVEIDPEYALAWVGIADVWNAFGFYSVEAPRDAFPKAKAAAGRALEIEPALAEAKVSLAYVAHYFDWQLAEAERVYREAIALAPSYATGHLFLANVLCSLGRFDEALASARRGLEHDPLSLVLHATLGFIPYYAGRLEEAKAAFDKCLELDPRFLPATFYLGCTEVALGRPAEGVRVLERAVDISLGSTWTRGALACALAASGDRAAAERVLEELAAAAAFVPSFEVAVARAALGEDDAAFQALEKALEERAHWMTFVKYEPRLARLRGDPRFAAIAARVTAAP